MSNDIFTLDENNNVAIRTLNVNPGDPETNSPSVFTLDEDGNACVRVTGTGGGGSVDESKVIVKSSTIPTADADSYRKMYIYAGETDATYTHGYIYECQKTSATYTGTVSFEAATLSGTTVACDGDVFANFLTEAGADPTPIVSGTMTYDSGADGWRLIGKDAEDNTITNFIEYTEDYTDAGFTFTGTPQDGDVVAFTCTVSEASSTYSWVRLDVQPTVDPLPTQTGNAGKFLTTDGTDASWSDKPLVNTATGTNSCVVKRGTGTVSGNIATVLNSDFGTQTNTSAGFVSIGSNHSNSSLQPGNSSTSIRGGIANGNYSVAIGEGKATGQYSTVINATNCSGTGDFSISVGTNCMASALNAIQMGHAATLANGTNSDANTFKVANANGNFEMMSADGTIPAARHATLPAADGTYVLKLVISGGVPTLSWVAE